MRRLLAFSALFLAACAGGSGAAVSGDADATEDAVTVDTSSPAARAQYDANVGFARGYTARCVKPADPLRKRVLVTGFGRFLDNSRNATGLLASRLVPGLTYPETAPPASGAVDEPGPQTAVATATVRLPRAGDVEICAMVLPVYWDLAAILVAKELDAFAPDLVLMNGIAGEQQDLWIELGAVNRAMPLRDGSDVLAPVPPRGATHAPIVPQAAAAEATRPNLLSWTAVKDAAAAAIAERAEVREDGDALSSILYGAKLAGYPRTSNTYLCNNVTYAVGYVMSHPGSPITLLKASRAVAGSTNSVRVLVQKDLRAVPRTFVHWPSRLDHGRADGAHLEAGAAVLRAIVDAQLDPGAAGPTRGDNARAEVAPTGDTF